MLFRIQRDGPSEDGCPGRKALALFAIGSFVTVFIVGIIWATSKKPDEHHTH
jgi:hypothetical protein